MKSLDPASATLHAGTVVIAAAAERLDPVWMSLTALSVLMLGNKTIVKSQDVRRLLLR